MLSDVRPLLSFALEAFGRDRSSFGTVRGSEACSPSFVWDDFYKAVVECYFAASEFESDCCMPPKFLGVKLSLSLEIHSCGRLSNFLIQLSNAVDLARRYRFDSVYVGCYAPKVLLCSDLGREGICIDGVGVYFNRRPKEGCVISSKFFDIGKSKKRNTAVLNYLPRFLSVLRSKNYFPQFSSGPAIAEDCLVIHIRSGDVFKSGKVHPAYGQPPLAYFTECIAHFSPREVIVVFEDRSNPVIGALESWLAKAGLPNHFHSRDLFHDLIVLNSAKAIVLSRGTFSLAATAFNKSLKTVYTFELSKEVNPFISLGVARADRSIVHWDVIDEDSSYRSHVLAGNWRNTSFQRRLMLNSPESRLVIKLLGGARGQ